MTSPQRSQPSIAAGIRDHAADDHMRGCMGRQYSCTCGYDMATEEILKIAAGRIEALEAALDNSQSLIVMLHLVGPNHGAWKEDDVPGTIVRQISENRSALSPSQGDGK